MSPTLGRIGPVGIARPTQDPPVDPHKGARWGIPDCLLLLRELRTVVFCAGETLLRRETSIAHHAFMSTTGEARGPLGERARDAFAAPTGVAP